MTWPLVNPAAGYRTFSRLVSFRCLPWISTVDDSLMTAPFSPTGRVFSIVATPYAMRLDARTAQFDNPPCAHVTSNFPFAICTGGSMKYRVFRTLPLFVVLSAVAFAQDLASFETRITVKKLNNGLTVVIC